MPKLPRTAILVSIFLIFLIQSLVAYEIPQRRIDLKPYVNFLFPNKLMENDFLYTAVEDDMGIGFGVKARTQISNFWGFLINTSFTDLKVKNNSLSTATIFTAGFYYTITNDLGDITIDAGYGVISLADQSAALLMPGLEFSRPISNRISISAEFGMPIVNDWFYDFNYKENYNSFSLSIGAAMIF